ncbi:MAG: TlpA disulfide reductase family protein [Verrucomicrobiales bacterium]
MMKKLLILLGCAALPALSLAKEKEAKPAVPNATLADVTWAEVVNGVAFDKAALAGKVVVVEEWGVNCGPCIASLPEMAKMAKSGEKKGLVVVGLERQNSSKEDILKVLKTAKVEYPVMSGGSAPGNTGGIPHACVFDVTGKLVFTGHPADQEFEKAVKKAMRDAKAEPKA